MTNAILKSAVAAIVLAAVNLATILGWHVPDPVVQGATTFLVLVASYFAPRIRYLGHAYAGAIGALVGGALVFLNVVVVSWWKPGQNVVAAISTVIVAIGALFVPSLSRSSSQ